MKHIILDAPIVKVLLIKPSNKHDCWHWKVLRCPYCGKSHLHGAGENPDTVCEYLTHRVAHCHFDSSGKGYNLSLGNPSDTRLVCLADIQPTKQPLEKHPHKPTV